MTTTRIAPLLLALALSLAGCAGTAPPPDRIQVMAAAAPPSPRHESPGHAPHPGWVWVSGYWNLVNERHIWVPGFWALPPQGFSSWDAAHWVHDASSGWVLIRGRWR